MIAIQLPLHSILLLLCSGPGIWSSSRAALVSSFMLPTRTLLRPHGRMGGNWSNEGKEQLNLKMRNVSKSLTRRKGNSKSQSNQSEFRDEEDNDGRSNKTDNGKPPKSSESGRRYLRKPSENSVFFESGDATSSKRKSSLTRRYSTPDANSIFISDDFVSGTIKSTNQEQQRNKSQPKPNENSIFNTNGAYSNTFKPPTSLIVEEECGELCHLHSQEGSTEILLSQIIEDVIIFIPILSPILAFFTYEKTSGLFDVILVFIASERNWVAVDGGAYQTQIITPAINGIVVPAISILFATLISNTVSTLRQRQLDIRTTLNMEAGELRILSSLIDSFPQTYEKEKCIDYLTQYISRLIAESQRGVKINSLEFNGSMDSEMNGFLNTLNSMLIRQTKEDDSSIPSSLISESYTSVTRLNEKRSTRISALQSTFPGLHYAILAALAGSICIAFLIETNQQLLIFLNAPQLKILWTMLIGTISALAVVCYDLIDPFRGSYQISSAVSQLFILRDALRASQEKEE